MKIRESIISVMERMQRLFFLWGIIFATLILTNVSCHKTATSLSDEDSDVEADTTDTSWLLGNDPCDEGDSRCLYNSVFMCYRGEWHAWDDCDEKDRTCIQYDERYSCS